MVKPIMIAYIFIDLDIESSLISTNDVLTFNFSFEKSQNIN